MCTYPTPGQLAVAPSVSGREETDLDFVEVRDDRSLAVWASCQSPSHTNVGGMVHRLFWNTFQKLTCPLLICQWGICMFSFIDRIYYFHPLPHFLLPPVPLFYKKLFPYFFWITWRPSDSRNAERWSMGIVFVKGTESRSQLRIQQKGRRKGWAAMGRLNPWNDEPEKLMAGNLWSRRHNPMR